LLSLSLLPQLVRQSGRNICGKITYIKWAARGANADRFGGTIALHSSQSQWQPLFLSFLNFVDILQNVSFAYILDTCADFLITTKPISGKGDKTNKINRMQMNRLGKYLTKLVIYFNFIKCIFLLVAKFMVY